MEAPKSKRSYVMKIISADLEQIRNVAIGAAGNLVFISNKKSNPEKFISINITTIGLKFSRLVNTATVCKFNFRTSIGVMDIKNFC